MLSEASHLYRHDDTEWHSYQNRGQSRHDNNEPSLRYGFAKRKPSRSNVYRYPPQGLASQAEGATESGGAVQETVGAGPSGDGPLLPSYTGYAPLNAGARYGRYQVLAVLPIVFTERPCRDLLPHLIDPRTLFE